MGEKLLFFSGDKSFELNNIGDKQFRWYSLIERGRRFASKVSLDIHNLRWVCEALKQASKGSGRLYRRWGRKQQQYLYRVYQNYNIHGRFVRIEVWHGTSKSAVIIPELSFNSGWSRVAEKILRFLGNTPVRFPPPAPLTKSYRAAANIESWPAINPTTNPEVAVEGHPLSRSLVGTFNDPFHHSPDLETIHKRFQNRWRVTAGFKVIPIYHNRFLFELPSRQEATRVKVGDWFWNGRHLSLDWWSPSANFAKSERPENHWLKVFGIPLHAWSMDSFKQIGDLCGGFMGVDEDTRERSHFFWARICVKNSSKQIPTNLNFELQGWIFDLSILSENRSPPLPTGHTTVPIPVSQSGLESFSHNTFLKGLMDRT